jgi:hypothetical protein
MLTLSYLGSFVDYSAAVRFGLGKGGRTVGRSQAQSVATATQVRSRTGFRGRRHRKTPHAQSTHFDRQGTLFEFEAIISDALYRFINMAYDNNMYILHVLVTPYTAPVWLSHNN